MKQQEGSNQKFTALLHHIYDMKRLRAAYLRLKKEAAAGVDGETWQHYGEQLEENLQVCGKAEARSVRAKPCVGFL